mmetsp:Transcript_24413/g.24848  ORF Transcript_24413/g.24848 Transcript_24413/m.24848 type:complete len:93 (-) Transcript_24413:470-748(-)
MGFYLLKRSLSAYSLCYEEISHLRRPWILLQAWMQMKTVFFTIDELNRWIETNKIVALVGEGRDAEVDREIEFAKEQSEKRQMASVDVVTSN